MVLWAAFRKGRRAGRKRGGSREEEREMGEGKVDRAEAVLTLEAPESKQ